MLNQLAEFSRSVQGKRRKRLARARRNVIAKDIRRSMGLEPLEGRMLLASNVLISGVDDNLSYVRTPAVGDDNGNVTYSPIVDNAMIGDANIVLDFEAGRTVTIDTINAAGTEPGNIVVNSNLSFINAVDAALILNADNDVELNGTTIQTISGSIDVILNADRDQDVAPGGYVFVDGGTSITTSGGNLTIGGGLDPTTGFTMADDTTERGVVVRGMIDTGDGDISIRGRGVDGTVIDNAYGIDIDFPASISSLAGNITFNGIGGNQAGNGNVGISILESMVSTDSGDLTLIGTGGGTGNFAIGVGLADGAVVTSQTGSVTVTGTSSANGSPSSDGIVLADGANVISSTNGSVTLTGASNAGGVGLRSGAIGNDVIGSANSTVVTINADTVVLDDAAGTTTVQGAGDLIFRPLNPVTTIGIGGGAGTLNLNGNELGQLANGFSNIFIGDTAAGTGAVEIDVATFADPVTIVGGSIVVVNGLTGDGDVNLTALDASGPGQDVTINSTANLQSILGNLTLSGGDAVTIQAGAVIDALSGFLTVNVDPVSGDADAEGGTATIDGNFTTNGNTILNGGDDADVFSPIADSTTYEVFGNGPGLSPGDTLNIVGAGEAIDVSDNSAGAVTFTGIELVDLSNVTSITYNGTVADDTLTLLSSPLPATTALLQVSAGPAFRFDPATAVALDVLGGDGDDTLAVDVTNGLPAVNVTFDGQGNVSVDPGDQISIFGAPAAPLSSLELFYLNPSDGSILIGGVTNIDYTNIEPITSNVTADDVTLNYSAASETITVTQPVAGSTRVDSTSGETTTFVNPNNNLTINTGGGIDAVELDGVSLSLAGTLTIEDPSGPTDDTVSFLNNPTIVNTGSIDLSVPFIEVLADLTAAGNILFGDSTGTGQILTGATVTSLADLFFEEPVSLSAATLVNAGGVASFPFSIDGSEDLSVTGGTGVGFLAANGALTPLNSVTATATTGVIRLNDFSTTGDQIFNSAVETAAGGEIVEIVSDAGTITFGSTIDNGSTPADSFLTDSDDVTTFNGAIGGGNPLAGLSIDASGPIVFANDVTVTGDIDITTADSGDTDNLIIQSPAVITAGVNGTINLNVLDDVNLQAGATINAMTLNVRADDSIVADDPGTGSQISVNATLNVSNLTTVAGGDDPDVFSVTPQAGSAIDVIGGNPITTPGDSLTIDGGGGDVTIDAGTGSITVVGAQPFNPTGIESLSLSNVNTLRVNGVGGNDIVSIAADPSIAGTDLLTINGGLPLAISLVNNLVYNGSDGDDLLTVDARNGLPTTPVTFNGQTQGIAGPGDQITILGTFFNQTFVYTAPDAEGNSGSIDLDGSAITYTGLEPISGGDSMNTTLTFNTGLANDAVLRDNASPGSIELIDNGATFENTFIPNPTNSLTINLGDQGDTLEVQTLDAAYAASMIINGGTGVDDVQFNSVTISNTPGRGLDVTDVATLGITNSTFNNNTADDGAGLRVFGGTTTIDNSTFIGNTATGDDPDQGGGAIFNDSNMTIQNGTVINGNSATGLSGSGGGIFVADLGTLTVLDSTIINNSANRAGGGIEAESGALMTLTNVTLDFNTAGAAANPGNGGGLHITGDRDVTITGGSISGNSAALEGGGLWNDQGTMTIGGGTLIDGNTASGDAADDGGGGIFNNAGSVVITGSTTRVQGNIADGTAGSGGGIFNNTGGTVSVTDSLIVGNQANRAGGGIEDASGAGLGITLDGVNLSSNNAGVNPAVAAPGNGGGLHVTGAGDVLIVGGEINGNTAAAEGGGLWNDTGTMTISGGTNIVNNEAQGNLDPAGVSADLQGGGGIFNNGGTLIINDTGVPVTIQNNLATGTEFGSGGGIMSIAGDVTVTGASILNNEAVRAGGGIEVISGTFTLVQSSLTANDVSNDDLLGRGLLASPGNGGGLHITADAMVRIAGGDVSDNVAQAEGGGLWNSSTGTLTVDGLGNNVTISSNEARGDAAIGILGADVQGGGGIFNNGGTLNLDGDADSPPTIFVEFNAATGSINGSGGGILSVGGNVNIVATMVSNNEAARAGGGIELVDGDVNILVSEISDNDVSDADLLGFNLLSSPGNGGGVHVTGTANVRIGRTDVLNNVAGREGGGLWNSTGTMTIENSSVIDGNTASGAAADDGGGGIFNNGGTLIINDNGTTISNNVADGTSGSGGGIFNNNGGTLTVTNATITGNIANRAGGGIEDASGVDTTTTLTGITLTNNNAGAAPAIGNPGNGGGLHVTGGSDVVIDGGTVQSNTAAIEGGGLWNDTGTLTIQNGTLVDANVARGDAVDDGGGGVFNNGGTVNVTGIATTISNNLANGVNGSGGGIMSIADGIVSVTDATISDNMASIDGGGIAAFGVDGNVDLLRATLSGNQATGQGPGSGGGGMLVAGSSIVITDSTFSNNRADTDNAGGGLFVSGTNGGGNFTVTNTDFNGNRGGGGAKFVDADGTITGGTFNDNSGSGATDLQSSGGGIAIVGETRVTSVDITGVTVSNGVSGAGAGIAIVDSQVVITDSTIRDNLIFDVVGPGAGIGALATVPIAGNLLEVINSTISNNRNLNGEGGAIALIDGNLLVTDSTITGNIAGQNGGAISALTVAIPASVTVRSSTISANVAQDNGGGIAVLNAGLDLENVTIVANEANGAGGGIAYNNNSVNLTRSIRFSTISSNLADAGGSNLSAVGSPIDVSGTIFDNGVCAAPGGALNSLGGNLDSADTCGFTQPSDLVNTDPLLGPLQDNGGPVFTLALLSGSPAIDAALAPGPATDARGIVRPIDGDDNGSADFDIGAFEAESVARVTVADVTVDEAAGTATVTVVSPVEVVGGFTVDAATSPIAPTTTPGDYAETMVTLTFVGTAGEAQTFTVPIVNDDIVEPTETILVTLSNPSNVTVDVSDTGLISITDNDNAALTVDDVTVNEGDGTATLIVSLDNDVQGGLTVDFTTVDGTAMQPNDYTITSGTLAFTGTAGETKTIVVPIIDDNESEQTETFNLTLSNSSNAAVNVDDTAVINIIDNDAANLTIADVTVGEGGINATVTVTLNIAVAGGFTVDALTSDNGATQGLDYTATNQTLTFLGNAGETQQFLIPILEDDVVEPAEGITVSLANSSDATIDISDTAVVTITDNDAAILTVDDVTVDEGVGNAVVTVTIDNAVQGGFTVDIATTNNGTARSPNDFVSSNATFTFVGNAGESQVFLVPIVDDNDVEMSETVEILLFSPSVAAVDASDTAVINITDNDTRTLTIIDQTVIEGGTATVSVMLSGPVAGGFTVDFATADGTAIQPGDYTATSGTLTFVGNAGETQTFDILTVDDAEVEPSETINVVLSNVSNLAVDISDTGLVNITDNDVAPGTISGHVFCDMDADLVEDAGEAAANVTVFLDDNGNGELDPAERVVTTDANGDYTFVGVLDAIASVVVQTPASCNTISSEPLVLRSAVGIGLLARSLANTDIDNDGDQDIVAVSDLDGQLHVLRNDGGQFTVIEQINIGVRPQSVAVFDDPLGGGPLIAAANIGTPSTGGDVVLLRGGLETTEIDRLTAGNGPIDVLLADVDGDNQADVISGAFRSSDLHVRLSSTGESVALDSDAAQVFSIAAGNIDEFDTPSEIMVAGVGYSRGTLVPRVEVFSFVEGGSFAKTASIQTGHPIYDLQSADVVGDGLNEVIALSNTGKLLVYAVVGGQVQPAIETDVAVGSTSFAVGDFNNDGRRDVAIANLNGQFIELYTGDGNGRFALVTTIQDITFPSDIVFADFNGDQIGDLAVTNFYGNPDLNSVGLRTPSTTTILLLDVAARSIVVSQDTVNFAFPTADPEFLLDVNRDGAITALDALRVINTLDRVSIAEGEAPSSSGRADTDVNGDGRTSAIDAVMIINHLGKTDGAEGESLDLTFIDSLADDDDPEDALAALDLVLEHRLV